MATGNSNDRKRFIFNGFDMNYPVLTNHTAVVGKTHLTDTLKILGIAIRRVFAPGHGFRGNMKYLLYP